MSLGRLGTVEVVGWVMTTVLIFGFCWLRLRKPAGGPIRTAFGLFAFAAPLAGLVATILCFAGDAHPLVQYNDESGLARWSAWAGLWPLLLLAALLGGLVALGLAAKEDRLRKRMPAWFMLALLNGIAFIAVFSNWPSA